MPLYEIVILARQDISNQQVEGMVDKFVEILTSRDGSVKKRENWGLRPLSYRIKKNRKAHYVMLNVETTADALQEMERNMRLSEDVLRYLSVRIDKVEEGPSAIMQFRDRRDDRGRGRRGDRRGGERGDRDRGDRGDRDRGDRGDRDRGPRDGDRFRDGDRNRDKDRSEPKVAGGAS